VIIGNQVRSLNSPAAVMTEFFQGRNATTGVIPGRFGKAEMSKSEDLPANEQILKFVLAQSLTGYEGFVCGSVIFVIIFKGFGPVVRTFFI